jgi:hypothetical protein
MPSNQALHRPSPLSIATLKLQQEKEELRRLAIIDPPQPAATTGSESLSARESVASRPFDKLSESVLSRKESSDNRGGDGGKQEEDEGEEEMEDEPISRTLEALDLEVVSSYNV